MTCKGFHEMQKTAVRLRLDLLEMFGCDGMRTGHWGGSSSLCEIMTALYWYKMKNDPSDPEWADRDYLIMSKGHSVPAQYAALCERGYFPREELARFKFFGTMLSGHPEMDRTPGVEANTGSLGQGLSVGLGLGLAFRQDNRSNKVYVIVGDGEQNEGQIWEAAMAIAAFGLTNVRVIVDCNGVQSTGPVADVLPNTQIPEKWSSFGWKVFTCDGHNVQEICEALDRMDEADSPAVLLAKTVKGKGVSFTEGLASFHNYAFKPEEYAAAKQELAAWLAKEEAR